MPAPAPVVVKLGGSLIGAAGLDVLLDAIAAAARPVAVVPGGGVFADAVRAAQASLGFSDSLAHRLALDAMGHFAEILAERRPAFALADGAAAVEAAWRAGRPALWTAKDLRAGDPEVPESWAVTSDSLALLLAGRLGAAATILVKSAEPPAAPARVPDLAACGLVDAALPAFLARQSGIVRILGPAGHLALGALIADPARPGPGLVERT